MHKQYVSHQSTGPLACLLVAEQRDDKTAAKGKNTTFERQNRAADLRTSKDSQDNVTVIITKHGRACFLDIIQQIRPQISDLSLHCVVSAQLIHKLKIMIITG